MEGVKARADLALAARLAQSRNSFEPLFKARVQFPGFSPESRQDFAASWPCLRPIGRKRRSKGRLGLRIQVRPAVRLIGVRDWVQVSSHSRPTFDPAANMPNRDVRAELWRQGLIPLETQHIPL
jgi:hypothetical protein